MLLTGTYVRTLDEKGRFSVPKRLRDALPNGVIYVAPGTDGSLSLYPEPTFSELAQTLQQGSPAGQDVRAFSRLFYAQSDRLELDAQGRVRVPPELGRLGRLEAVNEVVLIGVGDHLEVWNRFAWEDYLSDKQRRYDQIAENAFDRGTGTQESGTGTQEKQEGEEQDPRTLQPRPR